MGAGGLMGATPKPPRLRLPISLKEVSNAVKLHIQQITTIQTNVKALQPGDWEPLTLANGWTSMAGYIPAQVRIQQSGLALLVGHITGGAVANGTVIGTLTAGFFNAVHQHAFTANVIAGAASVANPVSQGTFGNGNLTGSLTVPSGNQTLYGTVSGSQCAIKFGPSGYQFSPALTDSDGGYTGQNVSAQSTNINYNSPVLTISTSGAVILSNASASATSLSFSEQLPLVTS